jgi:hypothetical protein
LLDLGPANCTVTEPSLPSPGWYPDPANPEATIRYWDGRRWTDSRAPSGAVLGGSKNTTSGFAIASMVLGIVWIYWIGSILAIIFGVVAKNQIRDGNGSVTGDGMATAGIVLGIIGLAIAAILIIVGVTAS